MTDLGQTNDRILSQVAGSVLVYLEANHDEQMLLNNPNYPLSLKRRILSSRGHLSNVASAKAIEKLSGYGTKQVVLSHLSEKITHLKWRSTRFAPILTNMESSKGKHQD